MLPLHTQLPLVTPIWRTSLCYQKTVLCSFSKWNIHLCLGSLSSPAPPIFPSLCLCLRTSLLLPLNFFDLFCQHILVWAFSTYKNNLYFKSICYCESSSAITKLFSFPLGSKFMENLNPKRIKPTVSAFLPHVFIPQGIIAWKGTVLVPGVMAVNQIDVVPKFKMIDTRQHKQYRHFFIEKKLQSYERACQGDQTRLRNRRFPWRSSMTW